MYIRPNYRKNKPTRFYLADGRRYTPKPKAKEAK